MIQEPYLSILSAEIVGIISLMILVLKLNNRKR